jgi:hypothetical protein
MTYGIGQVAFQQSSQDAFGRLRTTTPVTQFEAKHTYGIEGFFNPTTVNSGNIAFISNEAAFNLTVSTGSTDRALQQSYEYFQYHTGKSQLIILTGVFGPAQTNTVKRMGYYDDNDGLFFIQNGSNGFGICQRSSTSGSPVDTVVYQSSWNIDKMDGTGPSGITLDVTKANIYNIDFQWLGAGEVRFGVNINGILYYVHQINNANSLTTVYMKSAWLPVRYEVVNVGAVVSSNYMKQICSFVGSEGGVEAEGEIYAAGTTSTVTAATGATFTPLISIKLGYQLNGVLFRGEAYLHTVDVASSSTGTNVCQFAIFQNPTLTGSSFVAAGNNTTGNASAMFVDTSSTAMSGGITKLVTYQGGTTNKTITLLDDFDMQPNTVYTLAARGIGGSANTVGGMNWRELI